MLPDRLRPVRAIGLVLGDDYIVVLYFDHPVDPRELAEALDATERGLGIDPVRGIFHDLEHASFISLGFYRNNAGSFQAIPKVGRLLTKLFWTVTPPMGRDPKRLAATIANAFWPIYRTWPPMRRFLAYHRRSLPLGYAGYEPYYRWDELCTKRLSAPIDWEQNHFKKYGAVSLLFDCQPTGEQDAGIIVDPIAEWMYRVDTSDPNTRPGCVSAHPDNIISFQIN